MRKTFDQLVQEAREHLLAAQSLLDTAFMWAPDRKSSKAVDDAIATIHEVEENLQPLARPATRR